MASSDTRNTLLCYGTDDGLTLGAHLALNLQFITKVDKDVTSKILIDVITEWLDYITSMNYTANWLVGVYKTRLQNCFKKAKIFS